MLLRPFSKTVVFLLLIAIPTADSWWRRRRRRRSPPPPDTTRPTFSNCPSSWTETTTSSSKRVWWTEPTAKDNRGLRSGSPSRSGPSPGSTFSEGRHSIVYTATDTSGNSATCTVRFTVNRVRCSSIGSASRRSYSCSNSRYAYSRCSFSCSTGYYVSGSSSVTCRSNGYWSGSFPSCQIRTCSAPSTPSHGSKSCSSYNYGGTCSFSCNSGYSLSGSSSRTCQGSSWSGSTASCSDTQSPSYSYCPSNIRVSNDDRSTSAVVTYSTPTASDNSGSSPTITKQTGQDSGSTFSSGTHEVRYRATDGSGNYEDCRFSITVSLILCKNIPIQDNSVITCPDRTLKGATCTFSCVQGYYLGGPSSISCLSNGAWNDEFPTCTVINCPSLSAPENGIITSCDTSHRSLCTFSCDEGYDLIGSTSRTCEHEVGEPEGYWTEDQPRCEIKTCLLPPLVGDLMLLSSSSCLENPGNTVNFGSVCEYSCPRGQRLTGSHILTCQSSGSWLEDYPACNVITCDFEDLPEVRNGMWTGCAESSVSFGESCTLTCDRGYRLDDQIQKTCEDHEGEQGSWSSGNLTCSGITCRQLSAPTNGIIFSCERDGSQTSVSGDQLFDTSCTVNCDDGYTLTSGSKYQTCLVSGEWSGEDPVCADITPPDLKCPPRVVIYADSGQTTGSPTWDWEPLMASDVTGQYAAELFLVDGQQVTEKPPYFNEGSHTLTYSVSDNSGNNATCYMDLHVLVSQCPPPEIPEHGNLTGEGCSSKNPAIFGTVCQYSCNSGYEMTPESHEITCLQNIDNHLQGIWSDALPHCTAVQCIIPEIVNGAVHGCKSYSASYQESCQFICDTGYLTPDNETISTHTCQADRTWGNQVLDCSVQVTCPPLQVPINGTIFPANCTSTTMPHSSVCEYTCDTGYGLTGSSRVECLQSGSWSDPRSPICSDITDPVFEVTCPLFVDEMAEKGKTTWTGEIEPPSATDNAGHVTVRRRDGSKFVDTMFQEGTTPVVFEAVDESGNSAICIVNLRLEVRRCQPLTPPQDGTVESCSTHHGSSCNISCNRGYDLTNGSTERTCEVDENGLPYWSGSDTVCTIRRCPLLVPPENALLHNCGGTSENLATYASVCSFYCSRGFKPKGLNRVHCQANGTWSEIGFMCEAITCQNLTLSGGNVIPSECGGNPGYGRQCAFTCPAGYNVFPFSSARVTCLRTGEWSSEIENIHCKDTTLPVFDSCPPPGDLLFYTSPTNGTAFVTWPIAATDNSNDTVTITCHPERESSLEVGNYLVTCIARDSSGNKRHCIFNIEVRDRTCPRLSPPFYGSFKGPCPNKEGTNCTVICNENYRIVGSSEFRCETVNGITKWIPTVRPHCEAITCDPLRSFDNHGLITPFYCQRPSVPRAGAVCNVRCTDRFSLEATPGNVSSSSVQCGKDGSWNLDIEETFTCSDKVAPEIQYCPAPVRVKRTNILQPVSVYFDLPRAMDNSHEEIQPILTPSVTPPYGASEDMTINCLFQDSAGNQNDQCQINVAVIDVIKPVLTRPCPADIEVTASSSLKRVTWDPPRFSDPGGQRVFVSSNYIPGSMFRVGSYTVKYNGINERTGERTGCQFQIDVNAQGCPSLEAPPHGVLACHNSEEGQVCVLSCLPGYRRPPRQPSTFFCDSRGNWQPSRVADCGVTSRPTSSKMAVKASYSTNNCKNAFQAKQVAKAFLDQLLKTRFQELCPESSGCTVQNIKVTCGPVNQRRSYGRGKRSNDFENFENLGWLFVFDVVVDVESKDNVSDSELLRAANNTLQSLGNAVEDIIPPTIELPESFGSNTSLATNSFDTENVAVTCDVGFMFDDVLSECVECVAGTFFSENERDCHPCPVGSYQDEERQTECKVCPEGTSTDGDGAGSLDECYDLCPAGTSSQDGLFSCQRCDIGFYQPAKGQTTCISCPDGQRTKTFGATNASECSEPCPAGSSSPNGLSPCVPCPQRYYQPETGQRYCLICEGRKTTENTGSTSQSQCIDLDYCANHPCQNGGKCLSLLDGYICRCPTGITGQDCEVNVNECESGPCENGGICIDGNGSFQCLCTSGFTGPDCSFDINECDQHPCENGGTCVDSYGSYFCYCPPNFEGHLCETEKNYCRSDPCQNEGQCLNLVDGYDCDCPSGYTGRNCEQRKHPCVHKPCVNGDCLDHGGGAYQCSCFNGYVGEHCDISIDFCSEISCQNGGSCIKTIDGAVCVCPSGFAGDTCDHLRTICDDDLCLNGATCFPENENWANYSCKCSSGFFGKHCEFEIDECGSSPCSIGSTCHDVVDGYWCECPTEFEGYYDEICEPLDTCMVTPCINGGTCHHYEDSSSECECPPGYSGDRCEVEINECSSSPCMNFGFCIDKVGHYECWCLSAYTGRNCEIKLSGNADMIFRSSEEHDVYIDLEVPFENLEVPFIKLGYWFQALGDPKDFTLFEYFSRNSSVPDLKVQNISELSVELFGDPCFVLDNWYFNDDRWHNLLLTINTGESFEMAVDGVLVEKRNLSLSNTFQLGGRVRIGFTRTSNVSQVLVSGVHIWSYSGMEVFSACHPVDSGDILSWEQMLAISNGAIDIFSPSFCDDVDNCRGHPCVNNATCEDHLDYFLCICPDGFTGDKCDQKIDFCLDNKCQNDGSCVSTNYNFTCVCPKSFTGNLCHIPVEQEYVPDWPTRTP